MDFTDFHEMQNLLIAHAYYYQFGNIRVASKTCDKHFRLDAADIVLLSQLIYWTSYSTKEKEYWVYKTREELSKETMLSPKQVDRAREDLVAIGLLYYKVAGYPPTAYYKINFDRFIEYAKALMDAKDNADPVVYISAERLDELEKIRETEDISPPIPGLGKGKSTEGASIEVPDDWFPIFAKIRECGFYKDKADRDTKGEVFGYNQKLYTYISEILDSTFYANSGKNITNRHNLEGLTKDQILEWITKENRIPAGGTDYAHRTIVYTTSKATYSPMLNALCGKTAPVSSKPAKFIIKEESYEPSKKEGEEGDRSPSSIWFGENNGFNERPDKYYPELTLNHPRVWGLYHAIKDYAASCKSPEGIWTKHNKPGTTVSDIDILYWVLRVASDHGCTSDEIFQNIIIGDDSNYLWALVIQYVFNNKGYKLARDEKKSSYLYCGAKDLSPSMYTKVVGKGAKK